jgi:hypothetical protein
MMRLVHSLLERSEAISAHRPTSSSLTLHLAAASTGTSAVIGAVKVVLGLLSLSVFACVNGFYTIALVGARACALSGSTSAERGSITTRCLWASCLLLLASVLYVAYSGWAYFHPVGFGMGKYMAIGIAAVTFAEIGTNVFGFFTTRHGDDLPLHVMRAIGLAASLVSLVLTQTALLSFAESGEHDLSTSGVLGVLVGIGAAAIAVFEIRKCKRVRDAQHARALGTNRLTGDGK